MTTFTVETYQNEYLAEGGTDVDAVVTVAASGSGAGAVGNAGAEAVEIIIVDTSGSMDYPKDKIRADVQAFLEQLHAKRIVDY